MAKKTTVKAKTARKIRKKTAATIGIGWLSSDEEEVERRQLRAQEEALEVKPVKISGKPAEGIYRNYLVYSANHASYEVEYRDRFNRYNTCQCPDFQINQLGTCKHIERVSLFTKNKKVPPERTVTDVFFNPVTDRVEVLWADKLRANSKVKKVLSPYFSADNHLLKETVTSFSALQKNVVQASLHKDRVRLSDSVIPCLQRQSHTMQAEKERQKYLMDVTKGKRPKDIVNLPLYDYQREGMLHLAFKQRAILADEMGLGKTVQAVAACELLRELKGVERVLVVCPVSLKTEWEEQIAKFTQLPSLIIQGNRTERLKQYRSHAFFYLANYEQIRYDQPDIQELLAPDIIIFDEAQRVKNWQTKTAQTVKRLSSPYAFVLTGTPLENRIDEIYSIAQLVNPHIFGPLFRFNREFYQLDEKGRPQGYKNLDKLHQKLRPILLRRRKNEVEGELPDRVNNTYFVPMAQEQRLRYDEYNVIVAQIMHKAQKMPLTPEDFKRLQIALACMRMLCDSPYILDQACRVSPKLDELKDILAELLDDPDNKIILFSEWVKMLDLVQEHLDDQQIGYAVHTGQVQQKKRRIEINRFKNDPDCRVFLTSDAGATGLNLQVANVVINLDLPWNPAKLEQRIARAWRKQQKRRVSVINLVCENSIEHRMLGILKQKTQLAEGVLDGKGEPDMSLPSGRKAMIERLEQMIGDSAPPPTDRATRKPPDESSRITSDPTLDFLNEVEAQHPDTLDQLSVYENSTGKRSMLAVVKGHAEAQSERLQNIAATQQNADETIGQLEVIDQHTMATIQRLIDAGIISLNQPKTTLLGSPEQRQTENARRRQWLTKARTKQTDAERQLRMASLLFDGGFLQEALAPVRNAVTSSLAGLSLALSGEEVANVLSQRFVEQAGLPVEFSPLVHSLADAEQPTADHMASAERLLTAIDERLLAMAVS